MAKESLQLCGASTHFRPRPKTPEDMTYKKYLNMVEKSTIDDETGESLE